VLHIFYFFCKGCALEVQEEASESVR